MECDYCDHAGEGVETVTFHGGHGAFEAKWCKACRENPNLNIDAVKAYTVGTCSGGSCTVDHVPRQTGGRS